MESLHLFFRKLEFAEVIRRERIYPFRLVTFLWGARWIKKCWERNPLPSNEPRMFTDLSERINPFPTNTLEDVPFNEPAKLQFAACGEMAYSCTKPASTIFCRLIKMPSLAWYQVRPP